LNILKLIRWKNLLLIILTQYLLKYALLEPFGATTTLDDLWFALLVIASVCIAAAGYTINDIHDIEADLINKPNNVQVGKSISDKLAFNLFMVLNILGVGVGYFVANKTGINALFSVFVILSVVLYVYSTSLKQMPVVGNLAVAIVVGIGILVVGLFELLPSMTAENKPTQLTFFEIIFDYAIFAFMITFLRELIKDIEDVDGDYKMDLNTLPIAIGRERANWVAFVFSFIPIGATAYYVIANLYKQQILVAYFLIFVIAPLIYVTIKIFSAEKKTHYAHISTILKLVLFFGILSILLYRFVLK